LQVPTTIPGPCFNSAVLRSITEELSRKQFELESQEDTVVIYRHDEQYIRFTLKDGFLYTRLGVGHPEHVEGHIKSLRLDEMIAFTFGGLKRGLIELNNHSVRECLAAAMLNLWEFAPDFMNGDFRAFLRTAALKYRDEHGMLRESIILGQKKPA